MLRVILSKFTQDSYPRDWYGWMANQISHIVLGFGMVLIMCWLSFLIIGEIPYKWAIFISCAIIYAIFEVLRGWSVDALEDCVFVVIYGSGFTVLSFSEIKVGSPLVESNIVDFAWLAVIPLVHFAFGIYLRAKND